MIAFVLWRVAHRYVREIDRALIPVGLTHLQFRTLALLAWRGRSGEPVTQSDVARFGDIHPMEVSLLLKALEAKGMVGRKPDPSDTRAKRIAVTDAGVAVLRRAMPIAVAVQQRLFGAAGRPDGSLLAALLRIEAGATSGHVEHADQAHRAPVSDLR